MEQRQITDLLMGITERMASVETVLNLIREKLDDLEKRIRMLEVANAKQTATIAIVSSIAGGIIVWFVQNILKGSV